MSTGRALRRVHDLSAFDPFIRKCLQEKSGSLAKAIHLERAGLRSDAYID